MKQLTKNERKIVYTSALVEILNEHSKFKNKSLKPLLAEIVKNIYRPAAGFDSSDVDNYFPELISQLSKVKLRFDFFKLKTNKSILIACIKETEK